MERDGGGILEQFSRARDDLREQQDRGTDGASSNRLNAEEKRWQAGHSVEEDKRALVEMICGEFCRWQTRCLLVVTRCRSLVQWYSACQEVLDHPFHPANHQTNQQNNH
jgi:hypothetical protein